MLHHDFTYEATLASSLRAQWQLDDVLRVEQELDFSRNFLPDRLAGSAAIQGLTSDERRMLNQINANQYVCLFATVEELILPFVMMHAERSHEDKHRGPALQNFADEEAKHTELFKRFERAFARGFPVPCRMPDASPLKDRFLNHDPLAVGLVILMFEWMSQIHYLTSVRDDVNIEPLFKSLLKHHWMEEAQHAKLDTLLVEELAQGRSQENIERAMEEFFYILAFMDSGLKLQAQFNAETLERAISRPLRHRERLIVQQHQMARQTYFSAGLGHKRFRVTLEAISAAAAGRVAKLLTAMEPLRDDQLITINLAN